MLMSSIVRLTLGIKDHRVVSIHLVNNELRIELDIKKGRKVPCSICGARFHPKDRIRQRRWRHVSLWGIAAFLSYSPRRVKCPEHGVKVESIPWNVGKKPISFPLITVLSFWSRLLPWDQVARLFNVSWNTVQSAVQAAVCYGREREDYGDVRLIGIDEISRKKGHIYHTQVYDLIEKRLLWSDEDRTSETLNAFFDELGKERCEQIEAVCCDMWAPYIDVIKERLPNALLVFDKFHIVRHLMDAVDQVRKQEARELKSDDPDLLKKTRYIWLKNPWNLTENQRLRLSELEKINLKINRAYLLKEAFRQFWTYTYPAWAKKYLDQWFWWATHSRLKPMRDFAWMVRRHQDDILNYFKARIDNGAVEALNNKAKAISHRAYGYRTAETFKIALLHGLGKLPMPQLTHKFL